VLTVLPDRYTAGTVICGYGALVDWWSGVEPLGRWFYDSVSLWFVLRLSHCLRLQSVVGWWKIYLEGHERKRPWFIRDTIPACARDWEKPQKFSVRVGGVSVEILKVYDPHRSVCSVIAWPTCSILCHAVTRCLHGVSCLSSCDALPWCLKSHKVYLSLYVITKQSRILGECRQLWYYQAVWSRHVYGRLPFGISARFQPVMTEMWSEFSETSKANVFPRLAWNTWISLMHS